MLVVAVVGFMWLCSVLFAGALTPYVPVTLTSQRAGLVMESGAKVKFRGVEVGRVAGIEGGQEPVRLKLQLFPDQVKYIPANTQARIRATTIFGAKYVDLIYSDHPTVQHVSAGAVLEALNVTTEVNTIFQNLVNVLHQIDPSKLNAVLTAVADAVRGHGIRIGQATTAANHVLREINPRMQTLAQDWRAIAAVSDSYSAAAHNILATLDAASTPSATLTAQQADLNTLLLNVLGFSQTGTDLLGPNKDNLEAGINTLRPTTDLLMKYQPEYTCLLQGAKWWLDNGGNQAVGGADGRSIVLDDAFLLGDDPYRYPDNLPVVAAKGGPGGKPGCGSLPDASKNYPVRALVTDTGWGTGVDIRPNPGIGFPGWIDYLPVTRAAPGPPSIRNLGPPAPGPMPYPGSPPYGAALYAPDGAPLYPSAPGAPPPLPNDPAPPDLPSTPSS